MAEWLNAAVVPCLEVGREGIRRSGDAGHVGSLPHARRLARVQRQTPDTDSEMLTARSTVNQAPNSTRRLGHSC